MPAWKMSILIGSVIGGFLIFGTSGNAVRADDPNRHSPLNTLGDDMGGAAGGKIPHGQHPVRHGNDCGVANQGRRFSIFVVIRQNFQKGKPQLFGNAFGEKVDSPGASADDGGRLGRNLANNGFFIKILEASRANNRQFYFFQPPSYRFFPLCYICSVWENFLIPSICDKTSIP